MGKFLRVLVVFLLLFSIATLVLGVMLFNKRELLMGRTQKLEKTLKALTATAVEAREADPQVVTYPAKDIAECTAEVLDNPQRSDFWDNYKGHLEAQDQPKLDLEPKNNQLRQYYKLDPGTGKPEMDEYGMPKTKGPGTMQEVLDEVLEKSSLQYSLLNRTRQQLTSIREELVRSVTELNERKASLRQRLVEIVGLKDQIAKLEANVRKLEGQVASLEEAKKQLEGQIKDMEGNIVQLQDVTNKLTSANKDLVKKLKDITDGRAQTGTQATGEMTKEQIWVRRPQPEPGVKGSVTVANDEWHFVVVRLDDKILDEVTPKDPTLPLYLPVDLYVRRPDPDKGFVSKIRLNQVKKDEKLGYAEVLTDWQQQKIQKDDVVFF
jgi:myosin heavy subunit